MNKLSGWVDVRTPNVLFGNYWETFLGKRSIAYVTSRIRAVLTPSRYVGVADEVDDGELFAEKMARHTAQLKTQFEESDKLEGEIKKNLAGLGYDV